MTPPSPGVPEIPLKPPDTSMHDLLAGQSRLFPAARYAGDLLLLSPAVIWWRGMILSATRTSPPDSWRLLAGWRGHALLQGLLGLI